MRGPLSRRVHAGVRGVALAEWIVWDVDDVRCADAALCASRRRDSVVPRHGKPAATLVAAGFIKVQRLRYGLLAATAVADPVTVRKACMPIVSCGSHTISYVPSVNRESTTSVYAWPLVVRYWLIAAAPRRAPFACVLKCTLCMAEAAWTNRS